MSSSAVVSSSTRVKACSQCQRQKLRCDARNDYAKPCSRCRRLRLECVVHRNFEAPKTLSRADLRAEIRGLQARLRTLQAANPNASAPAITSPSSLTSPGDGPLKQDEFDSAVIEDCFKLFMHDYAPQVCILNRSMTPRDCLAQSALLYWTIVAIGSRKYASNPQILASLAPRLQDMVRAAVFTPDLATIQAFLFLCIWPMPIDTFGKEISSTLSAMMLQFSINKGLHIRGIGQDFSRVTLNPEPALAAHRAKLWMSCLITSQRLNCCYGLPPPMMIDSYSQNDPILPDELQLERRVSQLLSTATVELGRIALNPSAASTRELRSMIMVYDSQLSQISSGDEGTFSWYHYLCAQLQLRSFYVFAGQREVDPITLIKLYSTACTVIEATVQLDSERNISHCASDYTGRMLYLAASIVLRMCRITIDIDLDQPRGRSAYSSVLWLFRKMSIHNDDVMARSTVILTQLWNSQSIFNQPDGTVDSFSMLCRSRLAMSSVFDVWWRWRREFAGQPDPYPESSNTYNGRANHQRQTVQPSETTVVPHFDPMTNVTSDSKPPMMATMPEPGLEPGLDENWDALFDLPVEGWDLFNLDNGDLPFNDSLMQFPTG